MRRLLLVAPLSLAMLIVGCQPTTEAAARPASGTESPIVSAITPATLAPETAHAPTEVPTTPIATATPTATPVPIDPPAPATTIAAPPTATRVPTIASSATPGAVSVEARPASPGTEGVSPALIERGLQVYQQSYCGLCHQLDAAHTAGKFGPTHNHMGATAASRIQDASYTGAARTAAEYIRESIVSPQVYIVAGYENSQYHMPAFANLSEADLNALVQMLLQQK
jgi:mono/diheme cytochrome c family protein